MKNQKLKLSKLVLFLFSILFLASCGKGCQKAGGVKGSSNPLDFIPANNNLLVSINWKRFAATPFYDDFAKKLPTEAKELTANLESLLIALNIRGTGEPPSGLMIFNGNLDEKKILPILQEDAKKEGREIQKESFENKIIYLSPKDPNIGLSFISNSQLLAGQLSSIKEALTLLSKGGNSVRSNKELSELFGHLDTNKLLWGAATIPPNIAQSSSNSSQAPNPMNATLQELKAFSLSIDYDKNVTIDLTGNTQNATQAQNLANLISSYKTIFGSSLSSKDPSLSQSIQGMQISNQETSIKVSLKLPEEVIQRMSRDIKEKKEPQENQAEPSTGNDSGKELSN